MMTWLKLIGQDINLKQGTVRRLLKLSAKSRSESRVDSVNRDGNRNSSTKRKCGGSGQPAQEENNERWGCLRRGCGDYASVLHR
ncbi:hypothetical protein V6N13_020999 [Hibiscus sabdariffa]